MAELGILLLGQLIILLLLLLGLLRHHVEDLEADIHMAPKRSSLEVETLPRNLVAPDTLLVLPFDLLHNLDELAALGVVDNLDFASIVVVVVPLLIVQLLHILLEVPLLVHLNHLILDYFKVLDRYAV